MGREVRRVPRGWEHPKDENGRFVPLFGRDFTSDLARWDEGAAQWEKGLRSDFEGGWIPIDGEVKSGSYAEWDGERPIAEDYMPTWPIEECTMFVMYETCSEGTPISPAFETPEELARWCADNGASAFGSQTASYDAWLKVARGGWAPSAIITPGVGIESGVEGVARLDAEDAER